MTKKFIKNLVALVALLLIIMPMLAFTLTAQAAPVEPWGGGTTGVDEGAIQTELGLGNKDPRLMAATILNVTMGFLGIVAVVIILIGGFKWMTAGGGEDKVEEARKLIMAGIIGLIIILTAFAIAKFVINNLMTATGTTS
ncbi:MAG: hypothetical protein AAB653_01460 [Patescibacteria group bacterium]